MEFRWTTLTVMDIERSLKFYQEVIGLPLKGRFNPPGLQIAFLGEGETAVELIQDAKVPVVDLRSPITLGFKVDQLEAAMEALKAKGVAIEAGPFQPAPSTRFFYFRDPDGMRIQFVERK